MAFRSEDPLLCPPRLLVAVLDSPTSKVKVVLDQFTLLVKTLEDNQCLDLATVLIPCGRRLDLLNIVHSKAEAVSWLCPSPTRKNFLSLGSALICKACCIKGAAQPLTLWS